MKNTKLKILLMITVLALGTVVCASGDGNGEEGEAQGEALTAAVGEVGGTVQTLKADGEFLDSFVGQELAVSDQVLTHADSFARIDLSSGTIVRMGSLTTFVLQEIETGPEGPFARVKLELGNLWIILQGGSMDVETPAGLASVRGSFLYVWVEQSSGETYITCLEGTCKLGNSAGEVVLGAGQTASITNASSVPSVGQMSHGDVQMWLDMNPEATLVVALLTEIAPVDEPPPPDLDATMLPTDTPTATVTLTPTATAINCGPPEGWILHTVRQGETLQMIATMHYVTVEELQYANCLGHSTVIIAGQGLFVPDVATRTPTPTSTRVPTNTPRPTNTSVPATAVPTNSPTTFTTVIGPSGSISACSNLYKVDISDPEGIQVVKVLYAINDAAAVDSSPEVFALTDVGGGTHKTSQKIDTFANPGTDTVYYRFAAYDNTGSVTYYPDQGSAPLSYTDSLDCGQPDVPATFSNEAGPSPEGSIITVCTNNYQVDVDDPQGVQEVMLVYSVNDATFSSPTYVTLTYITGQTYGGDILIDTVAADMVYWKFKMHDNLGNTSYSSIDHSFEAGQACP